MTDRLAAALHATVCVDSGGNLTTFPHAPDSQYAPCGSHAALIHAADPTLICPDPADHQTLKDAIAAISDDPSRAAYWDGFVALQEHVRAVRCPDPADHELADAVRDLFSNGFSVLRGCPCGDEDHAEIRHLDADKAFAVAGLACPEVLEYDHD